MGWNRYARKADKAQPAILRELDRRGYDYWVIGWPDDVLVWHPRFGPNTFRMLSIKTADEKGRIRKRNDQKEQDEFVWLTGTPRVSSPMEALLALGEQVELMP